MSVKLTVIRLKNLIRKDAKRLADKILKQKKMLNRDKHRARVLLTNARRRVLMRHVCED